MAIRGCSSVIKARQDAAIAAGVAPLLTEVIGGVHATDRETCLRTAQCILGICGKNDDASSAFKAAGAGPHLAAMVEKHKDDGPGSMAKAHEMIEAAP